MFFDFFLFCTMLLSKKRENELIIELKKGSAKAYEQIFSEYYNWLCNYVFQLCDDRSLAEDIVQEVIIKFWEKRKTIIITTSLKSYLFKCCHNQFLKHLKSKKIKFDRLDQVKWDVIYESNVDNSIKEKKEEKLYSLINQLPLRCRQVFIQHKLHKRKYKEIAEDMDISIKTVENQMSKALHFLRKNAIIATILGTFY